MYCYNNHGDVSTIVFLEDECAAVTPSRDYGRRRPKPFKRLILASPSQQRFMHAQHQPLPSRRRGSWLIVNECLPFKGREYCAKRPTSLCLCCLQVGLQVTDNGSPLECRGIDGTTSAVDLRFHVRCGPIKMRTTKLYQCKRPEFGNSLTER